MPDPYVPQPDDAIEGRPVVFRPTTFARHDRALGGVGERNEARYPMSGRGRTTNPSAGFWGYLASGASISAGSGLSLGTGTVTLCSRSGTTLLADGDDVTVLNSGGIITGPQILELDWTDGDWAVCECGGPPPPPPDCLFCRPCWLPTKNLLYTYAGNPPLTPTPGSGPLVFDGTGHWVSAPFAGGYVVDLQCVGNTIVPRILLSGVSQCTFAPPSTTTCNPLSLNYAVPSPSAAATAGFTSLRISDPGPATPCPEPCDCTNCKLCGSVILLAGTVTDDNGTRSTATGIGGCGDQITSASLPFVDNEVVDCDPACDFILDPDNPPICTDFVLGSRTTQYSLCFRCPTVSGQPATITLTSWSIQQLHRCHDPAGFICGYTVPGGDVTRNAVITCTDSQLTATADFSDLGYTGDCTAHVPPVITNVRYTFPLAPVSSMCQGFIVAGCDGTGIAGATVKVYDHEGGTMLASATTSSSGGIPPIYFQSVVGSVYWITVSSPDSRFAASAASYTLPCRDFEGNLNTTTIVLPASGDYVCSRACKRPISKTLHATHPKYGPITLVYNASGSHGAGWYATVTYLYPGCFCCPSSTVTVTCFLNSSLSYTEYWKST
jgi:hypothetical protein